MDQDFSKKVPLATQLSLSSKQETTLVKTENQEEITSKLRSLQLDLMLKKFLAKLLIKTMVNILSSIKLKKNASARLKSCSKMIKVKWWQLEEVLTDQTSALNLNLIKTT